ncbi:MULTISPECIES: phage tail domain-containing protein [Lactococcus]|uniref:phage tail domain-containing protein n=1 Tax=Lactococcus TaxID=1357 RepID=UPI00203AA98B|nr:MULTISPECIES: phage tail domain-containing protein [Lactococcus]
MQILPTIEVFYRNVLGEELRMDRFGPIYLKSYEGFGTPENEVYSQKTFGKRGQRKTGSSSLSYRDMSIKLAIKEPSFEALQEHERQVMRILNPELAGTILFRDNTGFYSIDVEVLKGYEADESNSASTATATLEFRALDPEWRDEDVANKAIPLSLYKNKLKFPLAIKPGFAFATLVPGEIVEIKNRGDFAVGFELDIRFSGLVTNPRVYNVITQEFFGWDGEFSSGSNLYLSTIYGKKETWYKSEDGALSTNAMKIRAVGSSFFELDNINTNHLVMQADSNVEHAISKISFTPLIIGV